MTDKNLPAQGSQVPDTVPIRHVSGVTVIQSATDFFMMLHTARIGEINNGQVAVRMDSILQVCMSPGTAKDIMLMLSTEVQRHESEHGPIRGTGLIPPAIKQQD